MNLGDLFKQAKDVQEKAQQMQALLAAIEVEGVSGGGLVQLVLDGKSELKRLTLDPTLLKPEDHQVVEDLIVAAHADAKAKLERRMAEEMKKIAGSLGLPPGLGLT
jgi:DNA-binding YbaB/EbfC family protein